MLHKDGEPESMLKNLLAFVIVSALVGGYFALAQTSDSSRWETIMQALDLTTMTIKNITYDDNVTITANGSGKHVYVNSGTGTGAIFMSHGDGLTMSVRSDHVSLSAGDEFRADNYSNSGGAGAPSFPDGLGATGTVAVTGDVDASDQVMGDIGQFDTIVNENDTAAPDFTRGIQVTSAAGVNITGGGHFTTDSGGEVRANTTKTNSIVERLLNNGVTIEGVHFENSVIDSGNISVGNFVVRSILISTGSIANGSEAIILDDTTLASYAHYLCCAQSAANTSQLGSAACSMCGVAGDGTDHASCAVILSAGGLEISTCASVGTDEEICLKNTSGFTRIGRGGCHRLY